MFALEPILIVVFLEPALVRYFILCYLVGSSILSNHLTVLPDLYHPRSMLNALRVLTNVTPGSKKSKIFGS